MRKILFGSLLVAGIFGLAKGIVIPQAHNPTTRDQKSAATNHFLTHFPTSMASNPIPVSAKNDPNHLRSKNK
ncbi:MAG: hypothetical protein LR011_10875 [Verrucomicrobia bacterium]|nr:hypothetical protein [Verrucomicrobiota bacterium]